ncbi:hypothetical protein ACFXJ8_05870 [Nonomuraea sp. NPDC059194]|uniref:hypothetical protein n=1 Tax=Nonomuraea sp. NPDC059194 TaxID=3346764 RepID=UPI0036849481
MTSLERRYRWLLRAYPNAYRADHGEELLDILLESAAPGQALPPAREAYALLVGGLRTRIISAAQGPAWVDGLHLGVTALAVLNLAVLVPYATSVPLWLALSAIALVLILRGHVRPALPFAGAVAVKVTAITMGRPWLDDTLLPVYPDFPEELWSGPALYGNGGPVAPLTSNVLIIAGLLALSARRERPRTRSWWWLAAVPLVAGADPAWLDIVAGSPTAMTRVCVEAALLFGAAYAGQITADSRWAIAAGVYLVSATAVIYENGVVYQNIATLSRQDIAHAALLVVLTLAAALVPYRARRRILL